MYTRHEIVARSIRAGVEAMGLTLFPKEVKRRSPALTAFVVPEGLSSSGIRSVLKQNFGIVTAGGLGSAYKDTVIRIGHMGSVYPKDAIMVIGALEATMCKVGFLKEPGPGTAACIKALG